MIILELEPILLLFIFLKLWENNFILNLYFSISEPEQPEKLRAFNISTHSLSLHWSLPSGHVERYQVDLVPDSGFVTIRDLGGGEYQV